MDSSTDMRFENGKLSPNRDEGVAMNELESSGMENTSPEANGVGPVTLEANKAIKSNYLTSRLGNGDVFHNPENLVQFIVSGKNISFISMLVYYITNYHLTEKEIS